MIELVQMFNIKFGLPTGEEDVLMGQQEAFDYRSNFLQEELNEFKEAVVKGDRVKAFDALLDLVYVAHGTALFLGVTPGKWAAGMEAVHAANMSKVRALRAEDSDRGSTLDVVKPLGWVGPETKLKEILSWDLQNHAD